MVLKIMNIVFILMFISISIIYAKFYPRQINPIIGYRTKRSMTSEKTWQLANEYSSKWLVRYSLIVLVLQIFLYLIFNALVSLLGMMGLWTLFLIIAIIQTERKLIKSDL